MAFRSYTKDVFVPDGKIIVEGEYNGKTITDEIYIVPEEYTPILGQTWIRKFNIDLNKINYIHTKSVYSGDTDIKTIKSEFHDIFLPKIGCVKQFTISLKLREGVKPIFNREREVQHALVDKVNRELDQLETAGVITKTETSDWGSPLVVIPKSDGGVRLCVDYKIGVNERLVEAHNPIRKVEDIFNCLRNSKYFCRLDLFKAYLHIPVDEESSQIQTMSTHRATNRIRFEFSHRC